MRGQSRYYVRSIDSMEIPGWYDDPDDAAWTRYWDGSEWTSQREYKRISWPLSVLCVLLWWSVAVGLTFAIFGLTDVQRLAGVVTAAGCLGAELTVLWVIAFRLRRSYPYLLGVTFAYSWFFPLFIGKADPR